MGDLGVLAEFVITRLCGRFWSRRLRRKVVLMNVLKAHTNDDFMAFAPSFFQSPLSRPIFWPSFPWSPLCKISENGRFGCPCGICHNPALRALLEPPFAPKSCPMNVL